MTTIDIRDVNPQFADLLRRAISGEDVVIVENEQPLVRLTPVITKRIAGLGRGTIWMSDDFDEPLDDEFWLGEA
ncbi:MAG: type II toxin-antitoxin system prevent-host-death family antitoxin [Herpetosiphon sp.]|nr:type II toxin-antitoxin system prevent-host-death family antitoxin [Herpetosiphon sp.]